MKKELSFFKFDPSEWLLGNISGESWEVQGAFITICANYWLRGGDINIEAILKQKGTKKTVCLVLLQKLSEYVTINEDKSVSISFLDEQLLRIRELSKTRSSVGREGGLKSGEARANQTRTKREPNAKQNEHNKDIISKDIYIGFVQFLNAELKRDFKGTLASRQKFNARIKEGFTIEDFKQAVLNAKDDTYHKENGHRWLTPEFFTRSEKLERFRHKPKTGSRASFPMPNVPEG